MGSTDMYPLCRLEAQAKGVTTPVNASGIVFDAANAANNACAQPQLEEVPSRAHVTPLASGPSIEEDDMIEEIIRDTLPQEEPGFPPLDGFDQELFDAQLLEDICKLSCYMPLLYN